MLYLIALYNGFKCCNIYILRKVIGSNKPNFKSLKSTATTLST